MPHHQMLNRNVDKPIARRRALDTDDGKMPTLPTKPRSRFVLVLTAHTEPTVLFTIHIQRQTERMRTITLRLECKATCSVTEYTQQSTPYRPTLQK